MVGRLGTHADILLSESILGGILESMDSMLIDSKQAGMLLGGTIETDEGGEYTLITDIRCESPIGICVASSEGGTEPSEDDLRLFRKKMQKGVLMKVDVYAHQFSFYKVDDAVEDATVLFVERSYPDRMASAHVLFGYSFPFHDVAHDAFEEKMSRILEDGTQGSDPADGFVLGDVQGYRYVRCLGEVAVLDGCHRYDLASNDLLGDLRGLDDRRCLPGVGDQEREVILRDDGRGHLSDEMHIEP